MAIPTTPTTPTTLMTPTTPTPGNIWGVNIAVFAEEAKTRGAGALRQREHSAAERVWDFLRLYGLVGPHRPDDRGLTALHYAAVSGNQQVLADLGALKAGLETCAEENLRDEESWPCCVGMTALHICAHFNPTRASEALRCLLSLGAEVNARDHQLWTPLMHCCVSGNLKAARLLIEKGADVSLADQDGSTALHKAAVFGRLGLVQLLLDEGADPADSSSPLFDLALGVSCPELVPVLVGAGCPVDAQLNLTQVDNRNSKKGSDSRSPEDVLLSRLAIGSVTVRCQLELLLKHYQGMTPLMAASLVGNLEVVKALLHAGADLKLRNECGHTASDLAYLAGGSKELMQMLSPDTCRGDEGAV
mmetsp:Transcript_19373/g.34517  ORF Transcript_19373/g.34517 Transcript_19373/m.34517 type:complete len:361 (+) Transcript_19373:2457-3539(+)